EVGEPLGERQQLQRVRRAMAVQVADRCQESDRRGELRGDLLGTIGAQLGIAVQVVQLRLELRTPRPSPLDQGHESRVGRLPTAGQLLVPERYRNGRRQGGGGGRGEGQARAQLELEKAGSYPGRPEAQVLAVLDGQLVRAGE